MRAGLLLCAVLFALLGDSGCVYNCAGGLGTNVVKIKVHADGAALVALRQALVAEFSIDFNTLTAASKFFGGVFDMVNEELEPYGVQVRGDFTKVLLDTYNPRYDHTQCLEPDPVASRTKSALSAIKAAEGLGVGNRVVLLFCPELVEDEPTSSIMAEGSCGNVAGFMFSEIRSLKDIVYHGVMQMISRSVYKDSGQVRGAFNGSLCKYVKSCIGDNSFGKFQRSLKRVRHLAVEKYVVKRARKTREYPKVEQWSHLSHRGHDIRVYPTADYSNEDELFSDFGG